VSRPTCTANDRVVVLEGGTSTMAGLVPVVALVRLPLAVGRERVDRRMIWVGLARCWVLRDRATSLNLSDCGPTMVIDQNGAVSRGPTPG